MRLVLSLAALLMLAPMGAPGQGPASALAANVAKPVSTCPVGLEVGRHADGSLIPIDRSASHSPVHQWLDLRMTNPGTSPIISAELDVYGTENKARIASADSASAAVLRMDDPNADAVRHIHLDSHVAAAGSWSHLLSVEGLTSVAWVDVAELRYADGSRWHAGAEQACRVLPDPLMLIAGK